MAKKYTYTFKEIAEDVMKKLPGHYKNFDSANATVRATARELGINDINGKGKYKIVPAVQAEIILKAVIERATRRPYTPSTPIEQEIRRAEKAESVTVKEETTSEIFTIPQNPIPSVPIEKKTIVDDFELRRKRFYTDVNYFLKFAQSPDERTEIWGALSALYGISAQAPKQTAQPIPTETEEQHDKWSI